MGQPSLANQLALPSDHLFRAETNMTREIRLLDHPDGHRLPMDQRTILSQGFERMSHRMAIVQDTPPIGLPLIFGHDRGLNLARPCDDVSHRPLLHLEQSTHLPLQIGKQLRIGDHAVLDHFGKAGLQFSSRQRVQGLRINEHQARLMKGADQIFSYGMIDTSLAPDAGIHLSDQRSRDLDKRNPSDIDSSRKPSQIADDPTAQGQQH